MTPVDRIKELCKNNGVPVYVLERDLGFSNGYLSGLKRKLIPYDRAKKIAEYFHTTADYILIGRKPKYESESGNTYYLTEETAEKAQELFTKPGLRILFDAAQDATPEDLQLAADILTRLKESRNG